MIASVPVAPVCPRCGAEREQVLQMELEDLRSEHCHGCDALGHCFGRGLSQDQQAAIRDAFRAGRASVKVGEFDVREHQIVSCVQCGIRENGWLLVKMMRGCFLGVWGQQWSHVAVVHQSGKRTVFCREEIARGAPRERWVEPRGDRQNALEEETESRRRQAQ